MIGNYTQLNLKLLKLYSFFGGQIPHWRLTPIGQGFNDMLEGSRDLSILPFLVWINVLLTYLNSQMILIAGCTYVKLMELSSTVRIRVCLRGLRKNTRWQGHSANLAVMKLWG